MKNQIRILILIFTLAFTMSVVAQSHEAAKPQEPAKTEQGAKPENPNAEPDKALSHASEAATGKEEHNPEKEEEEEYVQLKQSPAVKWVASKTGMSPRAAYWGLFIANFLVLAFFLVYGWVKIVPALMKNRTADIQKGIEEARKASADAQVRLGDIEARLSKLDGEIASLQATAEADFSAEEARIKKQAEEDAKHVVEGAHAEIEAAARSAQRELKVYAAELAVNMAQKNIKVDQKTDEELVRGFVTQLGKDGK